MNPETFEGQPLYRLPEDPDMLYLSTDGHFKITQKLREEIQRLKKFEQFNLVAFTGRAGSGKNLAASFLLDAQEQWRQVAFAGTLKGMAQFVIERAAHELISKDGDAAEWINDHKEDIIPAIGKSPRKIYQTLGTEWGRETIHEDLWVVCTAGIIDLVRSRRRDVKFVITDLRFPNEEKYVRDNHGIIIRIIREDAPEVAAHKSEEQEIKADHIINNNGTPEQLKEQLFDILNIK